jgi:Transglycosylase SLT domain/SPOR domain
MIGLLKNGQIPSGSEFFVWMLLSTIAATVNPLTPKSVLADAPTSAPASSDSSAQEPQDENRQAEQSTSATSFRICEALATAATVNDLPIEFLTRLIWQESRFNPEAVSRAGARGIAQFMPGTATLHGLEDPFNALEAIAKSAQLLRDLYREFGNLGLAAAAYNARPRRVRDWLGGRRSLPGETRAYVSIVTGRSAEEWAGGQKQLLDMPVANHVPCSQAFTILGEPTSPASPLKNETVKPWGVEVVGGPTQAKALARYRQLQLKYPAILAGREPHVVLRDVIGEMGAARVRAGAETRADAAKLCAELRAAGSYCDVLRN